MGIRMFTRAVQVTLILAGLGLLAACRPSTPPAATAAPVTPTAGLPEWFSMKMTDVRSGQTFTMNDFSGKVVLVQAMAEWCPTCRRQGDEVIKLHKLLGNPPDLISVSLDTDFNEDEASLKKYAANLGYDWYFAVAPLEVMRAVGNLYGPQYMNPPVSPMLIIDRQGTVYGLPYGLKGAQDLQKTIEPFLAP
jgi:thiol-disulfide isomerase/thioredoxin